MEIDDANFLSSGFVLGDEKTHSYFSERNLLCPAAHVKSLSFSKRVYFPRRTVPSTGSSCHHPLSALQPARSVDATSVLRSTWV